MGNKKPLHVVILLLFSACLIIFARPALSFISRWLSITQKVNANILVIEGWLPYEDLKTAAEEFRTGKYDCIVTTGLRATPEYYNVNTDGYLIFYTGKYLDGFSETGDHSIGVKAWSELDGENSAHFNFWTNNTQAGSFTAGRSKKTYSVNWHGRLDDLDSVMIQFDNDIMGDFGDRNLYVKEVVIDKKFRIPFLNNSEYDITDLDGKNRIINNMNSNAETSEKRLATFGIDPSVIIAVPGNRVKMNRTLTSALAVREWINSSSVSVKGINIISIGSHSRRTWMTFRKVLNGSFSTGIIALPDKKIKGDDDIRVLKTIREAVAFLWYRIVLLLY